MNRSNNSKQTKNNHEDDQKQEKDGRFPSRVSRVHGGDLVEAISPEELVSFNDSECKHPHLVRDDSEKEVNAFFCKNPNCNEVFIYDKL